MLKSPEQGPQSDENNESPIPIDYFLRNNSTKENSPNNEGKINNSENKFSDVLSREDEMKLFNQARPKIAEALEFLHGLKDQYSRRAFHDAAANMQNFKSEDLVDTILDSGELDWIKNPAYYIALCQEIIARVDIPD